MNNRLTKKDLGMRLFYSFYKAILPINIFSHLGNIVISVQQKLYVMTMVYLVDLAIVIATYVIYIKNRKSPFYPIKLYYLTLCWCVLLVIIQMFYGVASALLAILLSISHIIYFTKRKHLYK